MWPIVTARVAWSVVPTVCRSVTLVSPAKTAEPTEIPFELCTRVGRRKHRFNRIRQMAPMCPHSRVRLCHLVNTIELSVSGGDAALCQITLTASLLIIVFNTCVIMYDRLVMALQLRRDLGLCARYVGSGFEESRSRC